MCHRVQIHAGVFFRFALLLMILPLRCILCFSLAAAIHELRHLCALRILRVPVFQIRIDVTGAVIETGETTQTQELISAAAGPLAGALTCLAARCFPLLALCAFVQTAYNLIPVYPFDGGRICRSLAAIISRRKIPCKDGRDNVQ
jgi:membrane-associated protease RseP (regulator of RpoE activity)